MKLNKYLFAIAVAFLLTGMSCTATEEEPIGGGNNNPINNNNNDTREVAPAFTIETTEGLTVSSADLKGKNYVIFFFGYNCPPCKAVGPDIESLLHQEYKDNPKYAIIGADQWEGNDAGVDDFQATTGITFPLGRKGASMANAFNTTYDRLVVVNEEGFIVYRGNSIAANNLYEVANIVAGLLD